MDQSNGSRPSAIWSLMGVDRMARPTDRDVRRQDNAGLRIE